MFEIAPSILSANFTRLAEEISAVKAGGASVLHVEADVHLQRTLTAVREAGARAGVAINPATPIDTLTEALPYADFVLLMSVNPGFGGQKFIPTMLDKLRRLKSMIEHRGLSVQI